VVVDALDDVVRRFYEQYGFHALNTLNDRTCLYLPMQTVLQVFGE